MICVICIYYIYIHILLLPGCRRWSVWLVWWKIPIQPDRQKVLKGKPTSLANSEEYVSTKGTNFFHLHSFCFQSVRGCNDFLPQAYMVIVIVTWWGEAPLLYSLCSTNRQTKGFTIWQTKKCTINIHKSNLPGSITLQWKLVSFPKAIAFTFQGGGCCCIAILRWGSMA